MPELPAASEEPAAIAEVPMAAAEEPMAAAEEPMVEEEPAARAQEPMPLEESLPAEAAPPADLPVTYVPARLKPFLSFASESNTIELNFKLGIAERTKHPIRAYRIELNWWAIQNQLSLKISNLLQPHQHQ